MKPISRILAAAAFALAAVSPVFAFEGVANFRIQTSTEKGQSIGGTGKVFVTSAAYRTEFQMSLPESARSRAGAPQQFKMTMLAKVAKPNLVYMVDDDSKTYSVWDTSDAAKDASNLPKETYTVERLGSGTVAGLSCQKARLTSSKGDRYEVCVSKDFGASADWLAAISRRTRGAGGWVQALKEKGVEGFPIQWSMFRKDQTEPFMTMELTSLDKKSLPASLFEVPAGYKQTEMAIGGLTPEQQKMLADARERMLKNMTPEQRKKYEESMKRYAAPTPTP